MSKYLNPAVIDAALDYLANNADKAILFNAYSADYATITAGKLAEVTLASGDFTKAAGDISGRKVTVAGKTNIDVLANGQFNHIALVKTATSQVLAITDGTAKNLNQGDKANFAAFDVEIEAP